MPDWISFFAGAGALAIVLALAVAIAALDSAWRARPRPTAKDLPGPCGDVARAGETQAAPWPANVISLDAARHGDQDAGGGL